MFGLSPTKFLLLFISSFPLGFDKNLEAPAISLMVSALKFANPSATVVVENKSQIFYLLNSNYVYGWNPDKKLNNLSSSNMLSISRIKELNLFM